MRNEIERFVERLKRLPFRWRDWAAGGLALLAFVVLWIAFRSYQNRNGLRQVPTQVLVANRPLLEGHILGPSDTQPQTVPRRLLPLGTLSLSDAPNIVGRKLIRPVGKGSLILWSDLGENLTPQGPSGRITPGYRAVALSVEAANSVAYAIAPGDHIDVVITVPIAGADGPTTLTLLQNVTVLDTGTVSESINAESGSKAPGAYSTLTLMILPKEVNLLTLAREQGKVSFVLRHPDDVQARRDLPVVGLPQLLETAFRNSIQDERSQTASP